MVQIPVYRAVLFAKSGPNSIYDSLIWLYLNCESVPPPSTVSAWIRWFLFSVLAALPAGGVTFLSRQESKQRSDQRRCAYFFLSVQQSSRYFLPRKINALSSGLLTRRYRSRRFCFLVVICVASRLNFNSVPLGAHIHALRMQGASCRRRITTHDSGLHLAHHRWVHHSLRRSAKL